jgi:hypothetical protein
VMTLVAGVIIFAGSYVIETAVFPTYWADVKGMMEGIMAKQGKTPDEIQTAMAKQASMMNPMVSACMGFVGTFVTGLVVSVLGAVLIRHKPGAPA